MRIYGLVGYKHLVKVSAGLSLCIINLFIISLGCQEIMLPSGYTADHDALTSRHDVGLRSSLQQDDKRILYLI